MKKAFTLVELLVIIAIIGVLIGLILPLFGPMSSNPETGLSYYDTNATNQYRCVDKYVVAIGERSSSKRVVLDALDDDGPNVVMLCDDDYRASIRNSDNIYAQFEKEQLYNVSFVGFHKEGVNPYFPTVKSVTKIER